jgi:hypothetical protein
MTTAHLLGIEQISDWQMLGEALPASQKPLNEVSGRRFPAGLLLHLRHSQIISERRVIPFGKRDRVQVQIH